MRELVKRDIKVRYKHSFLGMLWTVLNPLLNMIVLTIVFSNLFKTDIENFAVYVMIGQIVYSFFSEATNAGMCSVVWNSSLIKKVYIPKYLFPLSNVLSCLVNFGFSFVALLVVMLFTGAEFHISLLTVWIPLLYLLIFAFGFSLILCSINVFFRDMQHLYNVLLSVLMYLSVIFYSIDIVPEEFYMFVVCNPLYQFITFFRTIIFEGTFPDLTSNITCLCWAFGSLAGGLLFFYKTQDKFILHI